MMVNNFGEFCFFSSRTKYNGSAHADKSVTHGLINDIKLLYFYFIFFFDHCLYSMISLA